MQLQTWYNKGIVIAFFNSNDLMNITFKNINIATQCHVISRGFFFVFVCLLLEFKMCVHSGPQQKHMEVTCANIK